MRVNKLTVGLPRLLLRFSRCFGDNGGQVQIAPDRATLLGIARLCLTSTMNGRVWRFILSSSMRNDAPDQICLVSWGDDRMIRRLAFPAELYRTNPPTRKPRVNQFVFGRLARIADAQTSLFEQGFVSGLDRWPLFTGLSTSDPRNRGSFSVFPQREGSSLPFYATFGAQTANAIHRHNVLLFEESYLRYEKVSRLRQLLARAFRPEDRLRQPYLQEHRGQTSRPCLSLGQRYAVVSRRIP